MFALQSTERRRPAGARWSRRLTALPALVALLVAAGCSDSTGPDNFGDDDVRAFISAVATVGTNVNAVFRSGPVPTGTAGPIVSISGTAAMITGGSSMRTVTSTSPFNTVLVTVAGTEGYYELTLPNAVTAQNIIVTVAQDIPRNNFQVQYSGSTSGSVGAAYTENVTVVQVGTGNVQVSVSWNSAADVDLYLIEPTGEEIYYGNDLSAAGGELDLDSNAACSGGPRNENITYAGAPPRGTYTVKVNYWSSCGVPSTDYVVTVRVQGRAPTTHTGSFTGAGNGGGAGAGTVVTTFTY